MPHIHTGNGEFDFTVAGFLVHKDRTLLIKHKSLPLWTPPAGHIEPNQTPIDALYAEIHEEAGISKNHLQIIPTEAERISANREEGNVALPLPFDLEAHIISDSHQHINLSYVVKSDTDIVEPEPGESITFRWFTIDELNDFRETKRSIIDSAIFAIQTVAASQTGK